MALSAALVEEFTELLTHYPDKRSALIPALHRVQEEHGGWIAPEQMEDLATFLGLSPVEVFGVVSFYPMFRTRPRGRHLVNVCHNISCELRGAPELIAKVCEVTGASVGGTSADGRFTVATVECQGACTAAPMFEMDGVYHENLDAAAAERILRGAR
ncbi:MAG TPA: NAD(P)H-dependent oxidoreductase subunit E [Planctomycetota bacterium]|nr:NAD(P)H-dependent oxidoreductase subunit E [Planctomycetota bacterium]